MTGRIFTADHHVYDLPPLLSWNVRHTGTVPCDSWSVTAVYKAEMAPVLKMAAGFAAVEDGQTQLRGIVDEYSVELDRGTGGSIGELRVATRTQSDALILAMLQFYKLWMKVEQSRIGACEYAVEDGKFARKLCPRSLTGEQPDSDPTALGNRIAEYIRVFDAAMKAFFYNLNTPAQAVAEVEKIYDRYLSDVGQTV